jgi:hypothetical protein
VHRGQRLDGWIATVLATDRLPQQRVGLEDTGA